MTSSNSDNTKKRGRPATTGTGTLVGVRLLDALLAALDTWIEAQAEPRPTRPEAIRRLVSDKLKSQGYLTGKPRGHAGAREAGKVYAKGKAGAAVDRAQSETGHSDEVKASRKRKLTTVPTELGGPSRAKTNPKRARSIPAGKLNASNDG